MNNNVINEGFNIIKRNPNAMAAHGAALQSFNQELVKCLEDLKLKRQELKSIINVEEQTKTNLDAQIEQLCKARSSVLVKLANNKKLYDSYERTITDTESGFKKILESSQTLLHLAQHEANILQGVNNKLLQSK